MNILSLIILCHHLPICVLQEDLKKWLVLVSKCEFTDSTAISPPPALQELKFLTVPGLRVLLVPLVEASKALPALLSLSSFSYGTIYDGLFLSDDPNSTKL